MLMSHTDALVLSHTNLSEVQAIYQTSICLPGYDNIKTSWYVIPQNSDGAIYSVLIVIDMNTDVKTNIYICNDFAMSR